MRIFPTLIAATFIAGFGLGDYLAKGKMQIDIDKECLIYKIKIVEKEKNSTKNTELD